MKKRIQCRVFYLILCAVAFLTLIPFLFLLLCSFLPVEQAQAAFSGIGGSEGIHSIEHLSLIPSPVSVDQYGYILFQNPEMLYYFWNSIALALPSTVGTVLVSAMSGYGIAKFRFRGRGLLYFLYVLVMLLPPQITLVSSYIFFSGMGLLGNRLTIILPCVFAPFGAFLMVQFLEGVPDHTLEAGRLDGVGEWGLFWRIVLPQIRPGLASLAMLSLIECWNMIEQPLVLLHSETLYPLSVAFQYVGEKEIGIAFASAVFFMIPLLLLFGMVKEHLIAGISHMTPAKLKP